MILFFFLFFIHRECYLYIRIHNTQRNVCWHSVLFITTTSKITGLCWKRISWCLTHFVLQKAIMIKLAFKHYFCIFYKHVWCYIAEQYMQHGNAGEFSAAGRVIFISLVFFPRVDRRQETLLSGFCRSGTNNDNHDCEVIIDWCYCLRHSAFYFLN